jgi:hypothetical protein
MGLGAFSVPAWRDRPRMLGWTRKEQAMTQSEFNLLLGSLAALSPEQMRQLRDELDGTLAVSEAAKLSDLTAEEMAEQDTQRRLVAAGVLSEIKPPRRFIPERERSSPVPIKGEPLSETVIRERR